MIKSKCKHCSNEIIRGGKKAGIFCNIVCKGEWQRTQKPINRDELFDLYINQKKSTYEIGEIVNRDSKRVWEWLKDYDIPTRTCAESLSENAYGHKISKGLVVHPKKGFKVSQETKLKISNTRKSRTYESRSGDKNPMFGIKGMLHPNWKGGLTPVRQKIYSSEEWKMARKLVMKRDKYACVKCSKQISSIKRGKQTICNLTLHHIIPFSDDITKACKEDNLMLLCHDCHSWVHSKNNTENLFIDKNKQCGILNSDDKYDREHRGNGGIEEDIV